MIVLKLRLIFYNNYIPKQDESQEADGKFDAKKPSRTAGMTGV